jgi:hypothetical protein
LIASIFDQLGYIIDVFVASVQLAFASSVVYADQ